MFCSVCISHNAICEGLHSLKTITEYDRACILEQKTLDRRIHLKNAVSDVISLVFFTLALFWTDCLSLDSLTGSLE